MINLQIFYISHSLEVLPDALKTGCSKCNDTRKGGVRKILHHLIENKKDWYKELEGMIQKAITKRNTQKKQKKKD